MAIKDRSEEKKICENIIRVLDKPHRLIDADALDNAFTRLRFNADGELVHWGDRKDWCLHGSEVETLIADAPTIEAEPVRHGHWVGKEDQRWHCSECDEIAPKGYRYNYCPDCGAKMDGERR